MAMPYADGDDAPEAIQIALAGFVPYELPLALYEHDGLLVHEEDAGVHELFAQHQHFVGGRTLVRFGLVVAGWELWCLHCFESCWCSCLVILLEVGSSQEERSANSSALTFGNPATTTLIRRP